MGEAVVVLSPDVAREQVIERRNRPTPRQSECDLQPFGVLVEHRIDDVDEGLVAVENPVAAGEEIALEPTLALMLAEHLHHAAVRRQMFVARHRCRPPTVASVTSKTRAETVRSCLVRPEDAEVSLVQRSAASRPQKLPEHARRLRRRSRRARELSTA